MSLKSLLIFSFGIIVGQKSLICTLCDYSTNDRSNFKRHKRLHIRSNPVNVLKCGKCSYTTILPRKIREHYRQQHNIVYTCRQSECLDAPASLYSGQRPPDMPVTFQNLEMTSRQPPGNRTVSVAPSALHSLLTSVGPERLEYGRIHNPNLPQYEPYESHSQPLPRVQEPHMASNYLRSIVSTVLPPNPLHRVAATSTITSSSYYLNAADVSNHRHISGSALQNPSLAGMQAMDLQLDPAVKVKQEPVDMVMDTVSSSGVGSRTPEPSRQYDSHPVRLQRQVDPPDSISYMSVDRGNEAMPLTFPSQPGPSDERRRESRRESRYQEEPSGSQPHIKMETSSIGVQCAMPVVKAEPVERGVSENKRRMRGTMLMIERGTQCELIQCTRGSSQQGVQSYGSDSEGSDQQVPSHRQCSKCLHCGVTFDDEVLYSIHIGCHSHTDPYVCNVCGKHCHNKYGFYSHIMRGHQC